MNDPIQPFGLQAAIDMALVVTDYPASHEFYTNVVGAFYTGTVYTVNAADSTAMGFANDLPFKIYLYQTSNDANATTLKLITFDQTVPDRPRQAGIDNFAGVNYLTFTYDAAGYSDMVARVKTAGEPIVGQISNDIFEATYVRDPNGLFIELIHNK